MPCVYSLDLHNIIIYERVICCVCAANMAYVFAAAYSISHTHTNTYVYCSGNEVAHSMLCPVAHFLSSDTNEKLIQKKNVSTSSCLVYIAMISLPFLSTISKAA